MRILRFIGAMIIIFWLLGVLLRFAFRLFNLLLIVAAIVFLLDFIFGRRRY